MAKSINYWLDGRKLGRGEELNHFYVSLRVRVWWDHFDGTVSEKLWKHTQWQNRVICVTVGGHTVCTHGQTQAGQLFRNCPELGPSFKTRSRWDRWGSSGVEERWGRGAPKAASKWIIPGQAKKGTKNLIFNHSVSTLDAIFNFMENFKWQIHYSSQSFCPTERFFLARGFVLQRL